MVNLELRPASGQDAEMLCTLAEQIWKPYYRQFFSDDLIEKLFRGMYDRTKIKEWIETPGNFYFTVHADLFQSPIGYCAYRISNGQLWLDKIYLDSTSRKQKLGSAIMAIVTEKAVESECQSIALRVYRHNKAAIFFYLKNGFIIDRAVDFAGLDGAVYPDYLMSKQLSGQS